MAEKPMNVIILTSDEMRGDCPGFMGNLDCKTPCLDRFAESAVVMENHFTVHGKCVPSRIAMETGRYSHTDGFRTIHQHLPSDHPNLLGMLKGLGYESAVFGHNHVWEDFWGEDNVKGTGYPDYHSYTKGIYDKFLEKEWPAGKSQPGSREPMLVGDGSERNSSRFDGVRTGFCDDNRADQAVHYLTEGRDRSKPFYLHVNMGAPHPAYRVEEPYFSMYDPGKIKPWVHELPRNAALHMQKMREIRTGNEVPEEELLEVQAVYYGMITKVDMLLGRILDTIEKEGLLENSIVLFFVDHGDFAGQYGLVEKWDTSMADCIMHVPQIIHAPGLPKGKRISSLSEHTDITPTILELLGLKPDWGVHGESLLPLISREKEKDAVFGDGGHEEEMWDRVDQGPLAKSVSGKQVTYRKHPETMSRTKMVRTKDWKLVTRIVGGNELYNMKDDPCELNNLWGCHENDPKLMKVVLDLQARMIDWCLKTDTDRPFQKQVGA